MKCLVALSLLLHSIEINSANNCTREGEVRVIGTNTTCLLAGRLELCSELTWRAVCEAMWDTAEAMVMCRQFGFPYEGALACIDSCFGRNDNIEGINNFICSGEEDSLLECQPQKRNAPCIQHAGIVCSIDQLNIVTTLYQQPTINTATDETIHTFSDSTQCECPSVVANATDYDGATYSTVYTSHERDNRTITVALAGVSAVLLLITIGVVICWVCTCYRALKIPSSAKGPENSPTSYTSGFTCAHSQTIDQGTKESGEKFHQVIEESGNFGVYEEIGERKEEEVYHVLGDAVEGKTDEGNYEIPIHGNNQSIPASTTTPGENNKMTYSVIQHQYH